MMVGSAYLLPQFLGIGVCFGHLRGQEKLLLLHRGCSAWLYRLPAAQELLADVGRWAEIQPIFHLPSHTVWGFVHPDERSLFLFGSDVSVSMGKLQPCCPCPPGLPWWREGSVPESLPSVLSKELPQFSSASKHLFRRSFQVLWWKTNPSLAIHRRRIILCQETFRVL